MGKTNHVQPTSSKIYVDSFPEGNIESQHHLHCVQFTNKSYILYLKHELYHCIVCALYNI